MADESNLRTKRPCTMRTSCVFDRICRAPARRGNLARGWVEQAMFRAPFLAPSSCYGGEQCDPKEGCSVAQAAAELHCCSVPAKSDHMA